MSVGAVACKNCFPSTIPLSNSPMLSRSGRSISCVMGCAEISCSIGVCSLVWCCIDMAGGCVRVCARIGIVVVGVVAAGVCVVRMARRMHALCCSYRRCSHSRAQPQWGGPRCSHLAGRAARIRRARSRAGHSACVRRDRDGQAPEAYICVFAILSASR